MKYLNDQAIQGLKNYKYVAGEKSPAMKMMDPFWCRCVEFLPLWMAPNLVTLIGFLF
jgi:ethanolaminephosphotransferase